MILSLTTSQSTVGSFYEKTDFLIPFLRKYFIKKDAEREIIFNDTYTRNYDYLHDDVTNEVL